MYVHCDVYIHDIHVYVYLHGSTSRHMAAYLCFSALACYMISVHTFHHLYLFKPNKIGHQTSQ